MGLSYISEHALPGLARYKYSCIDRSILTKWVYTPFWNWIVQLLPLWLAPNLVTLLGFGWPLLNLVLAVYLSPDLSGEYPRWFLISGGLGMFYYQTMDGIDGKQARRTGTSSPLGELFDHGLDALNCTVGSVALIGALGLGGSWRSLLVLFTAMTPFWYATWEEYQTGTMNLGPINGPSEGLFAVQLMYLVAAVFGPAVYKHKVHETLPFIPQFINIDWIDVLCGFNGAVVVIIVITSARVVFAHVRPSKENQRKCITTAPLHFHNPVTFTLIESLPFITHVGSFVLWAYYAPEVYSNNIVIYLLTTGVLFAKLTGRVILARICCAKFNYFDAGILPAFVMAILNALAANKQIPALTFDQNKVLYAYAAFAIATYSAVALATINDIKHYLKIRCLHIPIKKD